jgi:F0F1-type ATP synthase membrane subunit b/b'
MRLDRSNNAAPHPGPRPFLRQPSRFVLFACFVLCLMAISRPVRAQEPAHPPAHGETTQAKEGGEHAGGGVLSTIAKLFNFALLAGGLVYFLRTPVATYIDTRSTQIRQDLVAAEQMRTAAKSQLEEIRRQLAALPAELDALRTQGAEDVRAERERIAQAAAAERERLLVQTRREIEMRLRVARRELLEHAAELAVGVAQTRITRAITPDDQLRLIDRYATQLKEAR